MLGRVSQMHAALASIVAECQRSSNGSSGDGTAGHEGQQGLAKGGARMGGGGTGARGNARSEGEGCGGEEPSVGGEGDRSVVTKEEGAVIVEKSRSCLRVSKLAATGFPHARY